MIYVSSYLYIAPLVRIIGTSREKMFSNMNTGFLLPFLLIILTLGCTQRSVSDSAEYVKSIDLNFTSEPSMGNEVALNFSYKPLNESSGYPQPVNVLMNISVPRGLVLLDGQLTKQFEGRQESYEITPVLNVSGPLDGYVEGILTVKYGKRYERIYYRYLKVRVDGWGASVQSVPRIPSNPSFPFKSGEGV